MFIELFLSIVVGILAGVFTGLIPGVHVNLLTVFVLALAPSLAISPILLAVGIVALALTHSFLATIPSIYLGAPDESTLVAVLPGHQLFMQGRGHVAFLYTIIGSYGGLLLTILLMPLVYLYLESTQAFLSPYLGKVLLGLVLILLVLSRKFFCNLVFFLLAGLLGLLCFSLPSQENILLPLLSGLFGTSTLLVSLQGETTYVRQRLRNTFELSRKETEYSLSIGSFFGIFASFFPGLGASQAAVFAGSFKKPSSQGYLLLVGCISTVNFVFSLLTVYVLDKARNGAIVGVSQLVDTLSFELFALLVIVCIIAGSVAVIIGVYLSKWCARVLERVAYKELVLGIIVFICLLVLIFSGMQGILILFVATMLGLTAQDFGASKNILLGCLLLPVIFYLW
jgi:putative membrane protein